MYLWRHGQSFFNLHFTVNRKDPGIHDPELTALGTYQAARTAEQLAQKKLSHIFVSPYTRALQTADYLTKTMTIAPSVWADVRERTAFSCDIGSSPAELSRRFAQFQFGHLPAIWWKDGIETAEETIIRANSVREKMRNHPDHATTVIVSHWGFILALTGKSVPNGAFIEYDVHEEAPTEIIWKP